MTSNNFSRIYRLKRLKLDKFRSKIAEVLI